MYSFQDIICDNCGKKIIYKLLDNGVVAIVPCTCTNKDIRKALENVADCFL